MWYREKQKSPLPRSLLPNRTLLQAFKCWLEANASERKPYILRQAI